MTSPCVLCAAHHRAASQERVDLLRRRRRCRLRRRDASMLLALLRVRRRPVPRADRARLSRAPVTTVTLPCLLCAAHHRATARERADLLRQRRRCRPRRRGASTLLALLRVRRRPLPRAEKARIPRAPATTVTSPRALCDTHHRATAQDDFRADAPCRPRRARDLALPARRRSRAAEQRAAARLFPRDLTALLGLCELAHRAPARSRVDLPCRRRRCRPRRRSVSALLAPWQARRRLTPRPS